MEEKKYDDEIKNLFEKPKIDPEEEEKKEKVKKLIEGEEGTGVVVSETKEAKENNDDVIKETKGFHFSLIALVILILCILLVGSAIAVQSRDKKKADIKDIESNTVAVIENTTAEDDEIETAEEEMAMTENTAVENTVTNTIEIAGAKDQNITEPNNTIANESQKEALAENFYSKYVGENSLKEVDGELIYESPNAAGEIHMKFDKNDVLTRIYVKYDCKNEEYVDSIKSTFAMLGFGEITSKGTIVEIDIPIDTFADENSEVKVTKDDIKNAFSASGEIMENSSNIMSQYMF